MLKNGHLFLLQVPLVLQHHHHYGLIAFCHEQYSKSVSDCIKELRVMIPIFQKKIITNSIIFQDIMGKDRKCEYFSILVFFHRQLIWTDEFAFLSIFYYIKSPPEKWHLDTSKSWNRSMKSLFHGMSNFTLDISHWDVSGVTVFVSNIVIV